jgi:hypothetical protein
VALICGYLLGTEPVHLQDIEQRDCPPRQYWTAPAPTRLDGPVRVLVSHDTFSGCEELAYNLQALGRARIVGETTRGARIPSNPSRCPTSSNSICRSPAQSMPSPARTGNRSA